MIEEKVKENGVKVKTKTQECMEEINATLEKYNCEPICIAQKMFGQPVWVWGIQEIKKP